MSQRDIDALKHIFKDRIAKDLPKNDKILAEAIVEVVAELLTNMGRIADALEAIAVRDSG